MASVVVLLCLITGVGSMTVIQNPPFLNLSAGDTARMSCEVINISDGEIVNYYWHVNSSQNALDNSSRVTVTPNSLIISSITPNDTGHYTCAVRDKHLRQYSGKGTYLSVTGSLPPNSTGDKNHNPPDPSLYSLCSLILLVPLLVALILCWRYVQRRHGSRSSSAGKRGGQTNIQKKDDDDLDYATILHRPVSGQRKEKRKEEGNPKTRMDEKKDDDDDLDYATILHRPASGQRKEKRKEERNPKTRMDEVEYAPVRIATTYHPTDMDPGNVCYATLRMSTPDIKPPEQSATYHGRV